MSTLKDIQVEVKEWADRNFGVKHESWYSLLGIQEEVGELSHHYLKQAQNIRTNEDHDAGIKDAVGDIVIYLMDFCNGEDIDLQHEIECVWQQVKQRNWKENEDTGESPRLDMVRRLREHADQFNEDGVHDNPTACPVLYREAADVIEQLRRITLADLDKWMDALER